MANIENSELKNFLITEELKNEIIDKLINDKDFQAAMKVVVEAVGRISIIAAEGIKMIISEYSENSDEVNNDKL